MGLTQEVLAEQAGFSVEYIKKLEGGSRRPSVASVDVLAHALELSHDDVDMFRAARLGTEANVRSSMVADTRPRPVTESGAQVTPPSASVTVRSVVDEGASSPQSSQFLGPTALLGEQERRLVTALFCEIAGFTSLDESLDPEDVRDVQTTLLSALRHQVRSYGGTVEGQAGGELLALFGVPDAHEDDPERAALCALGMQGAIERSVREVNERLGTEMGRAPAIRMGISTGEVIIVPRDGSGAEDQGVTGSAINGAAKLREQARPGEILVGQNTEYLTRRRVRYGTPRELKVEGRTLPVLVYPALGLNQSIEGLWQAVHEILPPAPFVGREREIGSLREMWEQAQAGDGRLVSIVGEPGVGKSRLIAEFVSQVTGDPDASLLVGRCLSYGQEVSLWLIADLLRSLFSLDEEDPLESIRARLEVAVPALLSAHNEETRLEARDVLGEVLGLPPSDSIVAKAGADVRRRTLVRSLRTMLEVLSSRGPTIVVLQDLHWIDAASEDVLGQLAVGFPGLRLLALVAQREGWSPPWSDLGWPERIALRPLPEEDAAALASKVMGNVRLSSGLEQYLADRAAGNPFFVEELARFLRESDGLHEFEGRLHLVPDVVPGLPATLSEVLQARLDRLESPAKAVAQVASVIGRSFAVRLLAEVVGGGQSMLEAPLRALQQAEIAFPRGYASGSSSMDLEYSFKHATVTEAAYNTLVRKRRQELHLRTARAIASLYPSDEYIETVAYHYLRTDAGCEAAEWFERAGDRAAGIFANDAAEVHYRNAVDRLIKVHEKGGDLPRVREKHADVLLLQLQFEDSLHAYGQALVEAPPSNRIWLARIHRKIGSVWSALRSFLDRALSAWDLAEADLGPQAPMSDAEWWWEWLDIQLDRMEQFYYHHLVDDLSQVAERIRPVVEDHGTSQQLVRFFESLVLLDLRRDAYTPTEGTLAYARKAVDKAEEVGDVGQLAWPLFMLGFTQLWYGRLDEAEAPMLRAVESAERSGRPLVESMCTTYLTVLYRMRGDIERVRTWNERALNTASEAKRTEYVAMAAANRGWLAWKEEDWSTAEAEARSAVTDWQSLSASYPYMFWWAGLWVLIDVNVRQGRMSDAIEHAGMLFGPDQARVPDDLVGPLHKAIDAWNIGDEETAGENLGDALELASRLAYL
jgi:class 3 adenylate cyclase/tetratricopeptide (TPR) repeat protein